MTQYNYYVNYNQGIMEENKKMGITILIPLGKEARGEEKESSKRLK